MSVVFYRTTVLTPDLKSEEREETIYRNMSGVGLVGMSCLVQISLFVSEYVSSPNMSE